MGSPAETGEDQSPSTECDQATSCDGGPCERKRRQLLGSLAAGGTIALAGCVSLLGPPDAGVTPRSDAAHSIRFLREGVNVDLRESETVLRGAERRGLELDYLCRAGYCGQCLSRADRDATEAVHMAVNDVDELNAEAIADGYFLPCTSQPRAGFSVTTNLGSDGRLQEELAEFQEPDEDDDDVAIEGNFVTYLYGGEAVPLEFDDDVETSIDDGRSLLVAGEDEEMELNYQCREGWCGQCMARVSGDARRLVEMTTNDFDPLDEDALAEGWTLTCTGYPRESFTLQPNMIEEFEDRE